MPTVTIDGRTVEVEAGTNLIEAGLKVGVQIPHYCYHPRLSIVGQCRMCLVEVEGMPKLQTACSTPVTNDGMVVKADDPRRRGGQRAVMEFLLINHPLDCPICDQAGECGLQDYSFKHGQAFSRFHFEDKRTYPEKERIPLGPHVLLNMNRCIQCTRCVRFTEEISKTGELGFFERGAPRRDRHFPGQAARQPAVRQRGGHLPGGRADLDRVPLRRARLVPRQEALDLHRLRRRLQHHARAPPRPDPALQAALQPGGQRLLDVRLRAHQLPPLPTAAAPRRAAGAPRRRAAAGELEGSARRASTIGCATATKARSPSSARGSSPTRRLSCWRGWPISWGLRIARSGWTADRRARFPNPQGGITGRDAAPNRRGAELAGLVPGEGGIDAEDLLVGDAAKGCSMLLVADSDFGRAAHDPKVIERLREAPFLVVMGWADTPLAQAADLALPLAHHAEREGTFTNCENRVQKFQRAFPAQGEARPLLDALRDVLARFEPQWGQASAASVFALLAATVPAFAGLDFARLPATGAPLSLAGKPTAPAPPAAEGPRP